MFVCEMRHKMSNKYTHWLIIPFEFHRCGEDQVVGFVFDFYRPLVLVSPSKKAVSVIHASMSHHSVMPTSRR